MYKCVYIERNLLVKRKKLFISPTSPNRGDTGCCTCYQATSDTLMYLHTRRLLTDHRRSRYCHFGTGDTWYLCVYSTVYIYIYIYTYIYKYKHPSIIFPLLDIIDTYITYRSMTYSLPSPKIFFVRS